MAALAAVPPVRAVSASASRVPAALLDQHLERGLVPSCGALRRRAPWAHGNDLQAPGDDSQPGPPPTMRRQTGIDVLCAYPRMPCEPDPGDLSAGRTARWHPDRTGVSIVSWTRVGLPGVVARRSARTATSGGPGRVIVSWMPCECTSALAAWHSPRHEPTDSAQVAGAGPAARHAMPRAGARAHPRQQVRQPGQGVARLLPHRRVSIGLLPAARVGVCCQPLGTPASERQGAPVRFAASRFARARYTPAVPADSAPPRCPPWRLRAGLFRRPLPMRIARG